jgi:hypothetical protein
MFANHQKCNLCSVRTNTRIAFPYTKCIIIITVVITVVVVGGGGGGGNVWILVRCFIFFYNTFRIISGIFRNLGKIFVAFDMPTFLLTSLLPSKYQLHGLQIYQVERTLAQYNIGSIAPETQFECRH